MVWCNLEPTTVVSGRAGYLYSFPSRYLNDDVVSNFIEVAGTGTKSFPLRLTFGNIGQYASPLAAGTRSRQGLEKASASARRARSRAHQSERHFPTGNHDEAPGVLLDETQGERRPHECEDRWNLVRVFRCCCAVIFYKSRNEITSLKFSPAPVLVARSGGGCVF